MNPFRPRVRFASVVRQLEASLRTEAARERQNLEHAFDELEELRKSKQRDLPLASLRRASGDWEPVRVIFCPVGQVPRTGSVTSSRLLLDEDVRSVRDSLRLATLDDPIALDIRVLARSNDLVHALNEVQPQIVHFSGHGIRLSDGLALSDFTGKSHVAEPAELGRQFKALGRHVRVVVLNGCFTQSQAEAIATEIDYVVGTRGSISDEAAITFSAAFYRAISFGAGVPAALEQAQLALALMHPGERKFVGLAVRAAGTSSEEEATFALKQLEANVVHLKAQLSLARALLATKDATIKALELANSRYRQLGTDGSSTVPADPVSENRTTDPIIRKIGSVNKPESPGFVLDMPKLLRALKRRFGSARRDL